MRKLIRRLHLALGLGIGLLAAISGLTGSVLVFRPEIDRLLNRELLTVPVRAGPRQLDAALAAVRLRFPDEPVRFARLATTPDDVYEVWIGGAPIRRIYVDPYDARILGWRGEHAGFFGFMLNLHEHLLAGEAGFTAVGIVGLLLLVMLVSGLVLWWPGRHRLTGAFRVRWRAAAVKTHFDLHRMIGIAALPLLFLAALTGSALVFHRVSAGLLVAALGGPGMASPPVLEEPVDGSPLPAAALVERTLAALPGAAPTWVMPPSAPDAAFIVRLRFPENSHPNGTSFVAVHPATGKVLAAHSHRAAAAGQQASDLRYPLHTGVALGLAGRIAVALAGLTPTVLLVTGTSFWLIRRRAGKTAARPRRSAHGLSR